MTIEWGATRNLLYTYSVESMLHSITKMSQKKRLPKWQPQFLLLILTHQLIVANIVDKRINRILDVVEAGIGVGNQISLGSVGKHQAYFECLFGFRHFGGDPAHVRVSDHSVSIYSSSAM